MASGTSELQRGGRRTTASARGRAVTGTHFPAIVAKAGLKSPSSKMDGGGDATAAVQCAALDVTLLYPHQGIMSSRGGHLYFLERSVAGSQGTNPVLGS